jgi:hypothetical protein
VLGLAGEHGMLARADVHRLGGAAEARDLVGELADQLRRAPLGGPLSSLARRQAEQDGAHAEQRGEVGRIESAHARTVARDDLDEATPLQDAERLAHRPPADRVGLGELLLLEPAARPIVTIHDAMAEMVGDLLRQGQRADRRSGRLLGRRAIGALSGHMRPVHDFLPQCALGGAPSLRAFANAPGKLSTKNNHLTVDGLGIEPRHVGRAPFEHAPRV